MQKYCLSALLLVFFSPLGAQQFAVMLDKMNALYAGVDNPFHVVVSDVAPERLILTPSLGTILADSNGGYLWRLYAYTPNKVRLLISDSIPEKVVDSLFFRVKRLPEPRFEFAKRGYHSAGGIIGYFDGYCSEFLRPLILGFDLEYIAKRQDPMVAHNTGAHFNGSAADSMNRLKPGDQVFISGITWRAGSDPMVRKSEEVLYLKVK